MPSGLTPTIPDRSWIVHPFGTNPWWTSLAAIIPALFAVILIFMDQEITAVIVNRSENKLKKGYGYHLDLLVLTISVIFCAIMGLPWMVRNVVTRKQIQLDRFPKWRTLPAQTLKSCATWGDD